MTALWLVLCLLTPAPAAVPAAVQQSAQTISWAEPSEGATLLLGRANPLMAVSSSGLPVGFRVESGPAFIEAGQVTATGVGAITIVAEQAGNEFYEPASAVRTYNRSSLGLTRLGGSPVFGLGMDVWVEGHLAYVAANSGGVRIFDVSDPGHPTNVGTYQTAGPAFEVQVSGRYAYVACNLSTSGLQILDVADPAKPILVATHKTDSDANGLHVVGSLVYLAVTGKGLEIVDVSDPAQPKRVGGCDTSGYARAVYASGNQAFIADSEDGLQIIDVTDPAAPVVVGRHDTATPAYDVMVVGQVAYVAEFSYGLRAIDISNPANPVEIGSLRTGGGIGVYADRSHAFVAAGLDLRVADVTNPATPIAAGVYKSGYVEEAKVVGDIVYLAGQSGLQICRIREGIGQTMTFSLPKAVALDTPLLTLTAATSSGLSAKFSIVSGPATVVGDQLTLAGEGAVVVRAEQAGNEQFLPASLDRTITVTRATQKLTWLKPGAAVLSVGQSYPLAAESSSGLPVTIRVGSGPAAIADGAVAVTGAGLILMIAEQAGDVRYSPLRVEKTFQAVVPPTLAAPQLRPDGSVFIGIGGALNAALILESSIDLVGWQSVPGTVSSADRTGFLAPIPLGEPQRFFRVSAGQ